MSWRCVVGSALSSTKCGVLCKRKRIRAGSGTPLITTPGRCWPMCSDDAKMFQRRRLPQVTTAPGALWHHEVLRGQLGSLRTAYRCQEAPRGQGEYTENREQAHQSPDPD